MWDETGRDSQITDISQVYTGDWSTALDYKEIEHLYLTSMKLSDSYSLIWQKNIIINNEISEFYLVPYNILLLIDYRK
jgi:hypothetical protein